MIGEGPRRGAYGQVQAIAAASRVAGALALACTGDVMTSEGASTVEGVSSRSVSESDLLDVTRTRADSAPWTGDAEPPPPQIGAYRILSKLGEGGMGVVYAAHHSALDRKVALKLVHGLGSGSSGSAGGRAQALREAKALARLSHPNVVHVYEVGELGGSLFVAMEYVDGETLEVWQQAPGRRLVEILGAYRQAALGLRAAHEAGLVHRDFKPSNAIVGADGRVRVLDFGLARAGARAHKTLSAAPDVGVGVGVEVGEAVAVDETLAGALVGTPAYMSPEQFEGREVDARSDVFSFCVALWEAIHGQRPFAGETLEALRADVTAGRRRPPSALRLPDRLRDAVERGLERDRARRPSALDPLIDALAIDPAADPTAASRERRIFFTVVGAVVLGVAPPVLVITLGRGDLDPRVVSLLISGSGLLVLVSLGVLFRRALLGNAYHRRMILFFGAVLLVVSAQRLFAILHDAPLSVLLNSDAHVLIGMCLAGAIFFARWMLLPAALIAALVVLVHLAPGVGYYGMIVGGPLFVVTVGYFWRRESRRLG